VSNLNQLSWSNLTIAEVIKVKNVAYVRQSTWTTAVRLIAVAFLIVIVTALNTSRVSAQAASNPPVGSVTAWAGPINSIPNNYMVCDGRDLDRTQYKALFSAIGTTWGGTAVNQFKIPDLRGLFLRGVDGGTGRDPDSGSRTPTGTSAANNVGSLQPDKMQAHKHNDTGHAHNATTTGNVPNIPSTFGEMVDCGDSCNVNGNEGNQGTFSPAISASTSVQPGFAQLTDPVESTAGAPRIGSETRPKNAYVYWIIRVK
jgi:microcystin-dependent protein